MIRFMRTRRAHSPCSSEAKMAACRCKPGPCVAPKVCPKLHISVLWCSALQCLLESSSFSDQSKDTFVVITRYYSELRIWNFPALRFRSNYRWANSPECTQKIQNFPKGFALPVILFTTPANIFSVENTECQKMSIWWQITYTSQFRTTFHGLLPHWFTLTKKGVVPTLPHSDFASISKITECAGFCRLPAVYPKLFCGILIRISSDQEYDRCCPPWSSWICAEKTCCSWRSLSLRKKNH